MSAAYPLPDITDAMRTRMHANATGAVRMMETIAATSSLDESVASRPTN